MKNCNSSKENLHVIINNSFLNHRINLYNTFKEYFKNSDDCLIKDKTGKLVLKINDISIFFDKEIGGGDTSVIYSGNNYAVKVMYELDSEIEIDILKDTTNNVISKKYNNMPIMYHYSFCKSGPFLLSNDKQIPYYIIITEKAQIDLKNFLSKTKNEYVINNLVFQCILSIYCFHKIGYIHRDSHFGNFLLLENKYDKKIEYNADLLKNISIPNIGYEVIIWDFGESQKINENNKNQIMMDYQYFKYNLDGNKSYAIINETNERKFFPIDKVYNTFLNNINHDYFLNNNENEFILQVINAFEQEKPRLSFGQINDLEYLMSL
jgi:hypothetical protein